MNRGQTYTHKIVYVKWIEARENIDAEMWNKLYNLL